MARPLKREMLKRHPSPLLYRCGAFPFDRLLEADNTLPQTPASQSTTGTNTPTATDNGAAGSMSKPERPIESTARTTLNKICRARR